MSEERDRTMRIKVYKTDETEYWDLPDWMKPYVNRVFGVYYFDPTRRVHCCEMTLSYEMRYLECQPDMDYETLYKMEEEGDSLIDEIDSFFREHDNSDPWIYMHCHHIDECKPFKEGFFPKGDRGLCCLTGFGFKTLKEFGKEEYDPENENEIEEQRYNYMMEEMLEYSSSNGI